MQDAVSVHNKIEWRPGEGRGNAMDADGGGPNCLANLGGAYGQQWMSFSRHDDDDNEVSLAGECFSRSCYLRFQACQLDININSATITAYLRRQGCPLIIRVELNHDWFLRIGRWARPNCSVLFF